MEMAETPISLMSLKEMLKSAKLLDQIHGKIEGVIISGISQDSRTLKEGDLFLAWKGSDYDAHDFLNLAVSSGATAVLVEKFVPDLEIPQLQVSNGRLAGALAADLFFGSTWKDLFIGAVTGTNGKTTTALLSRHILQGKNPAAALGTVGLVKSDGLVQEGLDSLTTPGPVAISRLLGELLEDGTRSVVMEASSHALAQYRLAGVRFDSVIFTNLSGDHLDYHTDMDGYFEAKANLLNLLKDDGVAILNADDPTWQRLDTKEISTFSYGLVQPADLTGHIVEMDLDKTVLEINMGTETECITLPLSGRFNVDNCLAAVSLATVAGMRLGEIADRLSTTPQIPGRFEVVVREPFLVIIDFAHTSAALENIIDAVGALTAGRLIVVFGAGGDRDGSKRPKMGKVVSRGADLAIVTSDNPRSENPDSIIDDIMSGMPKGNVWRISDRRSAIEQALSEAQPGDCVLLAGKGHERFQIVGQHKQRLDERAIILENLRMSGGVG
jgi:UDP-N-acetylmuramoyl-L-alanyl-D-glutamate--2,6-diaminopimelate ligase